MLKIISKPPHDYLQKSKNLMYIDGANSRSLGISQLVQVACEKYDK